MTRDLCFGKPEAIIGLRKGKRFAFWKLGRIITRFFRVVTVRKFLRDPLV